MHELPDFSVNTAFPIHWGEMDVFGHVNNVVYFRYFESARMAYFEAIAYDEYMKAHQAGPILAETQCRFRRPLRYPDRLVVGARTESLKEDRFTMAYGVWSERLNDFAAKGSGLVVHFDYGANVKAPIPQTIRAAIQKLDPSS